MESVLNFFRLDDAVPLILLICLLQFVGRQIGGDSEAVRWWARGVAAIGFIAYAAAGIATWEPKIAQDFLNIGIRALLAMGTVHGLALIIVPVLRFFYEHLWARPIERQRRLAEERDRKAEAEQREREAAEKKRLEQEQKADEERRRQEEIAKLPPPPTREERLKSAQERYEGTLKLLANAGLDDTELKAAQERAKQQYLREIDQVMNETVQHPQGRRDTPRQDPGSSPQHH